MKYYALYDNNKLVCIGRGNVGTEITEAEYNALLAEIKEKAKLVEDVYSGNKTIGDIPAEWQKEIQDRVNWLETAEEELTAEEALNIVLGGVTE